MKKKVKYAVIGGAVLILIIALSGGNSDEKPQEVKTENAPVVTKTQNQPSEKETQNIVTLLDITEYINKSSDYFIENLGNPKDGTYYNEPPTYTNWSWENTEYDFIISFEKGQPVKFTEVQFKDGKCDQNSETYLKKVGLEYPEREPDVKRAGHLYRWEPYNTEYERLNIYCNDIGTRVVLISEVSQL